MNTQILFNIDKATKQKAARRAAREGIPLSAVLKQATRAYADESLSLQPVLIPNKRLRRSLDQAHKDYLAGKNISGPYHTVEDFIDSLKHDAKVK